SDEGDYFNMDSSEMEAITIAKRIRNLVDNKEISITDRDTGKTRDIKYGDIVILMRGQKKSAPIFETALENENIPVYTQVGHSYLGSIEVMTVLSFLQIIDNPYQDIPLIAVMRSPLFGFTADELAVIRVASPKSNFFDALNVAEDVKSLEFCSTLNELRNQSEYMGIDEIVWKICTEFHYFALVGAMVGGEIRQANLKLLFERAVEYEQTSLDGLFGFMNYIETIKSEDKDLSAVKAFSDGDDVVRIMTIHASKGLEFPVVILADTAKRFNSQDMNKKILWHTDMGISMDYVDVQKRVRYPSVATSLMKERKTIQSKSEEMRLLYVAFTRAKEKLIISTTSNIKVNKWANTIFNNEKIVPENVDEYTCYADLIAISLLRHKNANQIRKMAEMACDTEKDYGFELKVLSVNHESRPIKTTERIKEKIEKETKNVEESSCLEEIKERLNYKYPHAELGRVPLKMSVTELKRRQAMDDGHVARLKCINDNSFKKTSEVTGAEIGTITHYVLQHMDFKKTETLEEVNEQVENMMLEGLINKTQFGVVNKNGIYGFFKSDIGMRLKKSINYKREFDFYMKINPCEIYPEIKCDEEDSDILVQGIADCIFEEDEHWVLLDYKTDKISPDKVQKKAEYYKEQIDLYTQGLNAILEHKKIEERYLYFLDCDMAIKL
ncbi:MAG: 3'-5' exonuclease, partial [Oscillospiraceae bacterium]